MKILSGNDLALMPEGKVLDRLSISGGDGFTHEPASSAPRDEDYLRTVEQLGRL